jgi:hypothetical protein
MTDEQFQALAKYEATFDQALHKGRAPYPGRAVIESFLAVMRSTNPRYKTNLNCGICVLHLVQDVGRRYFGEKKDREKAAMEKAQQEAQKVAEETTAPEKPKRTRKKKEAAE